jgi:branched-subunit amino acid transport protein
MAAEPLHFTLLTAAIAIGTLVLRAVFIVLAGRYDLPPRFRRALSFVPPAVFCALVVSTMHFERILQPGGEVAQRSLALVCAGIVAVRTRSVLWTIVSGMCALWLIGWLVRHFA